MALLLAQLAKTISPALIVPGDSGSRRVSGSATSTSGGVRTFKPSGQALGCTTLNQTTGRLVADETLVEEESADQVHG